LYNSYSTILILNETREGWSNGIDIPLEIIKKDELLSELSYNLLEDSEIPGFITKDPSFSVEGDESILKFVMHTGFRQTEQFKGHVSYANRRFIYGKRQLPFSLISIKSFDQPIDHYSHIKVSNGAYSVCVKDGTKLEIFGVGEKKISLQSRVLSLFPIPGTLMFAIVHEDKKVSIISNNGQIVPVGEDIKLYSSSSITFLYLEEKLYLVFCSSFSILIFVLKPGKKAVTLSLVSEWKVENSGFTCLSSFSYKGNVYLVLSDFDNAYYTKFSDQPGFLPEFKLLDFRNKSLNDGTIHKVPHFIRSNDKFIAWMNMHELVLIPIPALFEKSSLYQPCHVPLNEIAKSLKIENAAGLLFLNSCPFILTKYHCVIVSVPQITDNSGLCAVCLKNGMIAMTKLFNTLHVKGITNSPDLESFIITTSYCALEGDYSKETSLMEVPLVKTQKPICISGLSPTPIVSSSEILLYLITHNMWEKAVELLKLFIQKKKDSLAIEFLINEISLLSHAQLHSAELFVPKFLVKQTNTDMLKKINYIVSIRSFSHIGESLKSEKFISSAFDYESKVQFLIKMGQYKKALEYSIANKYFCEISIKDPSAFREYLSRISLSDLSSIMPKIAPFISKRIGVSIIDVLLSKCINNNDPYLTFIFLWLLCHEKDIEKYDKTISRDFLSKKLKPYDFLSMMDFCKSVSSKTPQYHLPMTSAAVAASVGLFNEASKIVRGYDKEALALYEKKKKKIFSHIQRESIVYNELTDINQIANKLNGFLMCVAELTKQANRNADLLTKTMITPPTIPTITVCSECKNNLSNQSYSFGCGHGFHRECLLSLMRRVISPEELLELDELCSYRYPSKKEKDRIEQIISQDCPICGSISIRLISKPLVDFSSLTSQFPIL